MARRVRESISEGIAYRRRQYCTSPKRSEDEEAGNEFSYQPAIISSSLLTWLLSTPDANWTGAQKR